MFIEVDKGNNLTVNPASVTLAKNVSSHCNVTYMLKEKNCSF